MKQKYIGECEHLLCNDITSSDCAKRHFIVFDYETFRDVKFSVCNDYLRMKIMENATDDDHFYRSYGYVNYRDVIHDLFSKELYPNTLNRFQRQDRSFEFVNFRICENPTIYRTESIFDMTIRLMEYEYSGHHSFLLNRMFNQYKYTLKEWCLNMLKYKKYKKEHEECMKIIKKLDWIGSVSYQSESMTELFNMILTFKTNKHETSKQ